MATEETRLLASLRQAQASMNTYREEIVQAKKLGLPVIWHAMYFPRELAEAYDAVAIPGEWYSAAGGPSHGVDLLETAEACGFPHELCSYSRMCLGSMVASRGFLGEFPKPDVVIGLEGACNIEANWFEFMARYYNVPFFMMDYPPVNVHEHREDAEKDAIEYFVQQAYRLIEFLEHVIGQKINEEKLVSACVTHHRGSVIWNEITELWHSVPAPITLRSLLTYLPAKMGLLACKPEGIEVALALRDELAQRVRDGVSGIADERMRLFWSGLVPYYHLRLLRDFEDKGAAIVGGSYFEGELMGGFGRSWTEPTNVDECLRAMGTYWITYLDYLSLRNRTTGSRYAELMGKAKIDGLVCFFTRMCRRGSKGDLEVRSALKKALDIPILTLEGSTSDPRDYSIAGVDQAVAAFLEQVMAHKERRERSASGRS